MDKKMSNYPPISELLIQKLMEDFPDKIPRNEQSVFGYGFAAGVQSVIDKLVFEYEEQQTQEEDN